MRHRCAADLPIGAPGSPPSPANVERYHHGYDTCLYLGGPAHVPNVGQAKRSTSATDQDSVYPDPAMNFLTGGRPLFGSPESKAVHTCPIPDRPSDPACLAAALPGNAEGDDSGHYEQRRG
jgi:hypothetical protein